MELDTHASKVEKKVVKSPRRLQYEAETRVFQSQSGSLEEIRQKLGLRPSQISKILKVHPSAWTRWTKTKSAPPHVFQMLEWYMELLQWRGQSHPLRDLPHVSKVISGEDPRSHVQNELAIGSKSTKPQPRLKMWLKLSIGAWCLQAVLWCFLMAILLKKS